MLAIKMFLMLLITNWDYLVQAMVMLGKNLDLVLDVL